jgi:general secretion pathway protein G
MRNMLYYMSSRPLRKPMTDWTRQCGVGGMNGFRRMRSRVSGWTVTEMMIVVLVIALLGAVAVPNIAKSRDTARTEQAKADLELLSNAILQLAWDTGKWPGGLDRSVPADPETWDLTTSAAGLRSATSAFTGWKGPYIAKVPLDPWGMPYFFDPDYRIGGVNRVVVGSFGPNKNGPNYYDTDDIYVRLDTTP